MKLYSDTELDNDIKYVKDMFSRYTVTYKNLGHNFIELNKTVSTRFSFILSQFKNLFFTNKIFV